MNSKRFHLEMKMVVNYVSSVVIPENILEFEVSFHAEDFRFAILHIKSDYFHF